MQSCDEWIEWEAVAGEFLARVDAPQAPDAYQLAERAGLSCDTVSAALGAPSPLDQQRKIAREVAAKLLRRANLADSFPATTFTAAALQLPREGFLDNLERARWNARELRGVYPNVSMGTIGYRVCALREAAVTWFDHGRIRWRSVSPGVRPTLQAPTRFERFLAEICLETDTTLNPEERLWAFPLKRHRGSALLVCDARRLLERVAMNHKL